MHTLTTLCPVCKWSQEGVNTVHRLLTTMQTMYIAHHDHGDHLALLWSPCTLCTPYTLCTVYADYMHTMQSVLQLVIRTRKQAFHSSRVCAFCFSSKLFQPARLSSLACDLLCIMCPHLCLLGRRKKTSLPTCGGIFSLWMRSSARWLEPDDWYEGKDQTNNLMSNLLHHFPINNFDLLITLFVPQKLCIIACMILIISK